MVNCSIETLMKLLNVIVGEADIAAPTAPRMRCRRRRRGGVREGGHPHLALGGEGDFPPKIFENLIHFSAIYTRATIWHRQIST